MIWWQTELNEEHLTIEMSTIEEFKKKMNEYAWQESDNNKNTTKKKN